MAAIKGDRAADIFFKADGETEAISQLRAGWALVIAVKHMRQGVVVTVQVKHQVGID